MIKKSRIFALDNTFNFSFVERRRVYFSKDGVPPSLMARGFFLNLFLRSCVRGGEYNSFSQAVQIRLFLGFTP